MKRKLTGKNYVLNGAKLNRKTKNKKQKHFTFNFVKKKFYYFLIRSKYA